MQVSRLGLKYGRRDAGHCRWAACCDIGATPFLDSEQSQVARVGDLTEGLGDTLFGSAVCTPAVHALAASGSLLLTSCGSGEQR